MHKERKHIRLKNFDYSSEGQYFITICTKNRECFFGKIENNEMVYSEIGNKAIEYWMEIPNHFKHVLPDEFIVMPNHLHGILDLNYNDVDNVGTRHGVSLPSSGVSLPSSGVSLPSPGVSLPPSGVSPSSSGMHPQSSPQFNQFGKNIKNSVSVIINQYKSSLKRWCNKNKRSYFQWQPRFHDHVIRNKEEYYKIQQYIINNPANWNTDKFFNH